MLGLEDYRQAYREGPYLQLCEKLWSEGRLVVVGCGFSDPWLGLIADRAITDSGARPVTAPGHVALVGLPVEKLETVGVERDRLEDRYHTGVLFYPVERRDDGVEDHGALLELLGELEERTAAPRTEPSPGSPRAPRRAGGDARTAWLAQVAEEHRRLTDHFERPVELQDLETAWVRLELALPEAAGARLPEVAKEGELMAGRRNLEEFLALDPKKQRWVTRRWLVEGDPGSGKTTLLRHLAGRLARGSGSGPIPVFISLPRLVEPPRLPQTYLADEYGDFCGPGLSDTIDVAGREGRLLVLLDGLDEVPPERRDRVRNLLGRIDRDWPESTVVVAGRPLGTGGVAAGFHKLVLQPLDDSQRARFLEKWFGHRSVEDPAAEARRGVCRRTRHAAS